MRDYAGVKIDMHMPLINSKSSDILENINNIKNNEKVSKVAFNSCQFIPHLFSIKSVIDVFVE